MEEKELREAIREVLSGTSLSATARRYDISKSSLSDIVKGYRLAVGEASSNAAGQRETPKTTSKDGLPSDAGPVNTSSNAPSADTWTFDIPAWVMVAGPSAVIGVIAATLLFFLRR